MEKEKQLQVLELENSNKQVLIIGLIAFAMAIIIIVFIFFSVQLQRSKRRVEYTRDQLEIARAELLDLNKTKDRFFAIIAHDIQGYSSSFLGLGMMIKDYIHGKAYDEASELANELDNESEKLNSLIDNLLSWALSQLNRVPYNPETVQIKNIAEEGKALFTHFAQAKNIQINSNIKTGCSAYADPNAVWLVFRNLLSNAIKFTSSEGTINIDSQLSSDRLEISISDNGQGMDEKKIEELLSSPLPDSSKGTRGERGTGLGLVLCREFLKINGGELEIQSMLGQGNVFTFSLPLKRPQLDPITIGPGHDHHHD